MSTCRRSPAASACRALPPVALLALAAACTGAGPESGWGGTVQDSAGIRIVSNPARGVWDEDSAWRLEEELRIGVAEGDPELQFGMVTGVDADAEGRIYVLDAQAGRIRVFGPDGALLRAFGRSGRGPGELSQAAVGLFAAADGELDVPDMMNQRLARFSPEGEWLGSVRLDMQVGMPLAWTRSGDRAVHVQMRRMAFPGMPEVDGGPTDFFLALDPGGEARDTLLSLPAGETFSFGSGGGAPRIRLFAPETLWTVTEDGRLVTGSNDQYSLEVRDPSGTLTTILRRAATRRPVTPAERSAFLQAMRTAWTRAGMPEAQAAQMAELVEFAESWPALAALVAGPEGTLWVQHVDPDRALDPEDLTDLQDLQVGSRMWDVFDSEGRHLGVLEMPEGLTPVRVVGWSLYGILRDDLGVQRVARYAIVNGPGGSPAS